MIEMPEATTIATQMNKTIIGKSIARFARGNLVHKFLWLNRPDEEFQTIMANKQITKCDSYGKSIYIHITGEYLLWLDETGGRILYHDQNQELPEKYHLIWTFSDGSCMTFAMQMWGFVRLLDKSEFTDKPNAEVGISPLRATFTFNRFNKMLEDYPDKTAKGIKGFLVTSVHINGLGNAYVQDILFKSGIHPARKIPDIELEARRRLYNAIQETMERAIKLGGRNDEYDLFNQPGCYTRLMDRRTHGTPCSQCGTNIEKIQYLGGACYVCSKCQS